VSINDKVKNTKFCTKEGVNKMDGFILKNRNIISMINDMIEKKQRIKIVFAQILTLLAIYLMVRATDIVRFTANI
jgi:hypothetical protein